MKAPLTPRGPQSDAFESRHGTEAVMEQVTSPGEEKTPLQEAMQARGDAINAAVKAKENLGHVATSAPERRPMAFDSRTGTLMTPSEVDAELAYRQDNGRHS